MSEKIHKIYLRIADGRRSYPVKASAKRDFRPLEDSSGNALPTIFLDLNLKIPKELFKKADSELYLEIDNARTKPEIEISQEYMEEEK